MNRAPVSVKVVLALVVGLVSLESARLTAAELQTRTSLAFQEYVARVEEAFLSRVRSGRLSSRPAAGVIAARPGGEDGIIAVPGGLIHHWIGGAFLENLTLRKVLDMSQAYSTYPSIYRAVMAANLIEHDGDTYRTLLRLKGGEGGITAVLQVRSTVRYAAQGDGHAYSISTADEIREVKNAGARSEELLPAGRDSGYLWRAIVLNYYVEDTKGVYIETETLGLSRGYPPLLGWVIEPIARRLGRKSVELSLREFRSAAICAIQYGAGHKCVASE